MKPLTIKNVYPDVGCFTKIDVSDGQIILHLEDTNLWGVDIDTNVDIDIICEGPLIKAELLDVRNLIKVKDITSETEIRGVEDTRITTSEIWFYLGTNEVLVVRNVSSNRITIINNPSKNDDLELFYADMKRKL